MRKTILLGCNITGLGVARSLAREKVTVMAVPLEQSDIAQFSRYVAAKTELFSIKEDSEKLLERLLTLDDKWSGALVIGASDEALSFIMEHKNTLETRFIPAIQDSHTVRSLLDKGTLYNHAAKNLLPLPWFFFPESEEHIQNKKAEIIFPCILKPCDSHLFAPIFHKKVWIINDFEELLEAYTETQRYNLRMMVVEIIPGTDDSLFHYRVYINQQGKVIAEMCTQKMRQSPPKFGVARMSKTIPMIPETRKLTLKLLENVSYHGFASAEFKYDYRDKKYKLMEINLRPVLPERLFFDAGMNFTHITYMDCVEGISLTNQSYRKGVLWISNFADIIHFIKERKEKNYRFLDYFRPYFRKATYCIPFFEDPVPFIVNICMVLNVR